MIKANVDFQTSIVGYESWLVSDPKGVIRLRLSEQKVSAFNAGIRNIIQETLEVGEARTYFTVLKKGWESKTTPNAHGITSHILIHNSKINTTYQYKSKDHVTKGRRKWYKLKAILAQAIQEKGAKDFDMEPRWKRTTDPDTGEISEGPGWLVLPRPKFGKRKSFHKLVHIPEREPTRPVGAMEEYIMDAIHEFITQLRRSGWKTTSRTGKKLSIRALPGAYRYKAFRGK